jgi:hypothetical protein
LAIGQFCYGAHEHLNGEDEHFAKMLERALSSPTSQMAVSTAVLLGKRVVADAASSRAIQKHDSVPIHQSEWTRTPRIARQQQPCKYPGAIRVALRRRATTSCNRSAPTNQRRRLRRAQLVPLPNFVDTIPEVVTQAVTPSLTLPANL